MNHSVFAYPGNKSSLADWVCDHLTEHRCYVEVFGGAAGVLANKPESYNEVYNDIDEDLVQFFDVLRERDAELKEWLQRLPYAREKYDAWADRWYSEGWRPDDAIKRAGVFFFLRSTSFGGTYQYPGGFAISSSRNQARTYAGQVDRLEEFAQRFRNVVVENRDCQDVIESYDSDTTLFYLDPPYYDTRCRYRHGHEFDHDALASTLANIDGDWLASYGDLPPSLEGVAETVVERTVRYNMGSGYNGEVDPSPETLAMSYDPKAAPSFVDEEITQTTLVQPDGGCNDRDLRQRSREEGSQ